MYPEYRIEPLHIDEIEPAMQVVGHAFSRFVASGYTGEGIRNFYAYIMPDEVEDRLLETSRFYVARSQDTDTIIGVVEIRAPLHIALLFISPDWQGQGIGRNLLRMALSLYKQDCPTQTPATVNSSPYAVSFYTKLGFTPKGPEEERTGIRFVPMERKR